MECPNGCGDMEQLVSIVNGVDAEFHEMAQTYVQVIYERCHECEHQENIDVIVTEDENQNQQEVRNEQKRFT